MESGATRSAVLLDRHPLWLHAIEPVLSRIAVEVVGMATDPHEALDLVEEHEVDLLIVEPETADPELSGTSLIRHARERHPSVKVIVLANSGDTADVAEAFDAGAVAYVVKTAHPDDIAAVARQVFEPSVFLANGQAVAQARNGRTGAPVEASENTGGLTRRELEILALVAEGHSNGQMARKLWVTEQTIKFHLSNIYRKLDVANRTEAASWAHRHHLVAAVAESA